MKKLLEIFGATPQSLALICSSLRARSTQAILGEAYYDLTELYSLDENKV